MRFEALNPELFFETSCGFAVPCGLVVTRGIAELAGVETPNMDEVILWCQDRADKEFIDAEGKLAGKDLNETRAPQRYGFHDLDAFMKTNGYIS